MVVIHRIYIKNKRQSQILAFTLNYYVPLQCTGVTFVTKLPCYYTVSASLLCVPSILILSPLECQLMTIRLLILDSKGIDRNNDHTHLSTTIF